MQISRAHYMRMAISKIMFAALLLLPPNAFARDFACQNNAAEIRCGAGKCAVETASFTPMSLTRHGAILEICAYSGCRSGPIMMRRTFASVMHLHAEVGSTTDARSKSRDPLSVIFDEKDEVATMWWGGFANAMTCKLR
jgi:hypothetical protein